MRESNNVSPLLANSSSSYQGISAAQSVHTQLRLSQTLQTSLNPDDLLNTFFIEVNSIIHIDGMSFSGSADNGLIFNLGRKHLHRLTYGLVVNEKLIGEITFFRRKKFTAIEQNDIEFFLSMLVYPLRNAMEHRSALLSSKTDSLTGLGNRMAFDEALKREVQLAQRYRENLSVSVIDVDFFKRINDTYGHQTGDAVLKKIGETLHQVCRSTDMAFRYGGEEFVVLLSKTDESGAMVIAERLRNAVEKLSWAQLPVTTISIGIASVNYDCLEQPSDVFFRADKALYRAKESGRNCVCVEN